MKIYFCSLIRILALLILILDDGKAEKDKNTPGNNREVNNNTNSNKVRRMVGGEHVSIELFPWTTLIISRSRCGGALIDVQWVLTAAHCITSPNPVIYFGIDRLTSASIMNRRHVVAIYKPKKHIFTTGDLALLKLDRPVPIRAHSTPIRLNQDRRSILKHEAVAAGFGHNYLRSEQLLAGHFQIEPVFMISTRDIIGARSRYQSPCYGDSGSGLIVERDNQPYLVGITSSILAARCQPNHLALYTDVAYYHDWIMDKMNHEQPPQRSDNYGNYLLPPSKSCWSFHIPWTNFKITFCNSWFTSSTWTNIITRSSNSSS